MAKAPGNAAVIEPLLKRLELRDRLHPPERVALEAAFLPPVRCAAGEELVRQGSSPSQSILLLEGLTCRRNIMRDGRQQTTALHTPGDFVDLHSFLLLKMDHCVLAVTDSVVACIPHTRVRDLVNRYPHLGRLLWLSTLLDAAIHRQWIVGMVRLNARQQLAHLFCEAYLRLQVVGLASRHAFELPLTVEDLADVHAQPVDAIVHELEALREAKVVSKDGAHVRILNWQKLTALAEFDPTYLQLGSMPV